MRDLAVLSMHTSPLAQPGTGDGGGMNVYVRELVTALARSGVRCEVFTRADDPSGPAIRAVEPGFRVHHVPAGPPGPVPKEMLPGLVEEWTDGVARRLERRADEGRPVEAIHAHYWLSGVAGHRLKHVLQVPLVSTFHTLDRVKAEWSPEAMAAHEPARRAEAEAETMACSDLVLASCDVEVRQLVDLYGAEPGRIAVVAPGVDHTFFGLGDRAQARRAVGESDDVPIVVFAGRIQPLKGLALAVDALGRASTTSAMARGARLVAIGGPSGPHGEEELARARELTTRHGLGGRVRLVPPQPHQLLATFFRAADVCVVPSRSESFGLVALEAAACGLPVLASAVGGLTTIVADGGTGRLLDPGDAAAWGRALAGLLDDPLRADRLGRAGAAAARSYTWARAADTLRRRMETILAREPVACH